MIIPKKRILAEQFSYAESINHNLKFYTQAKEVHTTDNDWKLLLEGPHQPIIVT